MDVVVVSPRALMRKALCSLLATMKGVRVVLDVERMPDGLQPAKEQDAAVLLIDLVNTSVDLETASYLRQRWPKVKLLFLLDSDNDEFQARAIKEGASGCVSMRSDSDSLRQALEAAAHDEIWIDHGAAIRIITGLIRRGPVAERTTPLLTHREQEVLALVAMGFHNKEIASRLFVSDNTVKTHLLSIYKKLEVSGRLAAAIQYFHQVRQQGEPAISPPPTGHRKPSLGSVTPNQR